MPETISVPRRHKDRGDDYSSPIELEVATEAELLEFANAVRAAGAADALEALLPSRPSASNSCLIANALNFECLVDSFTDYEAIASDDYEPRVPHGWRMYLGAREELARNIADTVPGCTFVDLGTVSYPSYAVNLPPHIGNAAHAFDAGVAFQDYAEEGN